jgi:hypothetical protein
MRGVFLSYRRSDTAGHVGRINDRLAAQFGDERVFMDVGDIAPGEDFTIALERELEKADRVLVVIGDDWLTVADHGKRRLDDPSDHHRLEIERGLALGKRVIPVLVEGARMPAEAVLPPSLRPLARLQAVELRNSRWEDDVRALARALDPGSVPPPGGPGPTGRPLVLGLATVALGILGAVVYLAFKPDVPGATPPAAPTPRSSATPSVARSTSLAGTWRRENGSRWAIAVDGDGYRIDEIHNESKQAWMRGRGELRGDRFMFALDHLFGSNLRIEGNLALAPDGHTLSGTAKRLASGNEETIVLVRE